MSRKESPISVHAGPDEHAGDHPSAAADVRLLQVLTWLLIAGAVLPGALAVVVNGRPEDLGSAVVDRQSLPVTLLGLLPTAAAVLLVAVRVLPRLLQLRLTWVSGLQAAVIVWATMSTVVNGHSAAVGAATLAISLCGIAGTLLAHQVRAPIGRTIILPFAGITLVSLLMIVLAPHLAFYEVARAGVSPLEGRLAGLLDHPNQLGVVSGTLVVVAVTQRTPWRWVWIGLGAIALVLTESRTSWFATAAAAIAVVVLSAARRHQLHRLFARAGFVAMLLCASVPFWMNLDRFMVVLSERPAVWDFVIPRIPDALFFGHGWGELLVLRDGEGLFPLRVSHAHNLLAQELFAGGLVGAFLMIALLWVALHGGLRRLQAGDATGLGLVLFVVFSSPFDLTASALGSAASALLLALLCMTTVEQAPADTDSPDPESVHPESAQAFRP